MNNTLKQLFGNIPTEWAIGDLKDLTQIIVDGTHFTPKYTSHGIPFLRVTDLKNNIIDFSDIKYISEEEHKILAKRCKPQKGDILLSKNGTIGITKIVNWDWEFSIFVSLALIRVKDSVLNNIFLSYFFNSVYLEKQIKLQSKQGTVTNLHLEEIRKFKLPLPPLPEQQKIADILTTVDDKLENIESQITEYTNLKTGLMQQLLTKGIGHTKFVDSELGMIPEGWRVVKLKEIVKFNNGKAHEGCVDESGNYIIVNSKFISTEGKTRKYTNENLCPLRKGDIALVMSDIPNGKAIAKCFIVKEDNIYTLNQRICSISPINGISEYLFYILNRNKYYLQFDNGVSQTNLRKDEVLECPILFPPIAEQMKIADILSTVDIKLESIQQKKEEFTNMKKGLMEQLLTGRIRVKV